MRFTWLAALAVGVLFCNITGAEARSRTEQTQASRSTTARPAAAPQARSSQANRATAARRSTAPQRQAAAGRGDARQASANRSARGASTRGSAGRAGHQQASGSCRGRNCGATQRQVTWQSGLAPATNAQAQSCPAGTLATLARGHSDVVRCLPL